MEPLFIRFYFFFICPRRVVVDVKEPVYYRQLFFWTIFFEMFREEM